MIYPVIQFLLKICTGRELDNTFRVIQLMNESGQRTYRFTEVEYLHYLYNEGRSTRPVCKGVEDTYIAIGRRGGATTLEKTLLQHWPTATYVASRREERTPRLLTREQDLRGRRFDKVVVSGVSASLLPSILPGLTATSQLVAVGSTWLEQEFSRLLVVAKSNNRFVLQVPTWEASPSYGPQAQLVDRSVYSVDL